MSKNITLRDFNSDELVFDADETRTILKFIFKSQAGLVDNLEINDKTRTFAQGLLLEAIESSNSMSSINILFTSSINPGASVRSILLKFGKNASKHWFKNNKAETPLQTKVYESVRKTLELSFWAHIYNAHSRSCWEH